MADTNQSTHTSIPSFGKLLTDRCSKLRARIRTHIHVNNGTPIFKPNEINKTLNPIARLLRMFMVDNNITYEQLKDQHERYTVNEGKRLNEINNDRNNLKKALAKQALSVKKFERLLLVLGYCIDDLDVHIKNVKTGEVKVYSISDASLYLNRNEPDTDDDDSDDDDLLTEPQE